MLVLLAMAVPLNVGGMGLVATLPGGIVLGVDRIRRGRTWRRSDTDTDVSGATDVPVA
jgi:hypothetical protein